MFNSQTLGVFVKEAFDNVFWKAFEQNYAFWRLISSGGDMRQTMVEKNIDWPVQTAGTPGVGSYAEEGPIGITRNDLGPVHTRAQLGWRLNKAPVKVTGLSQAISRSPSAAAEALAMNSQDAVDQLQRNLNRQLLSDGVGNLNGVDPELNPYGLDITGVQACWDDGSRVPLYAGIDRATNLFWRSFVIDNGGTPQALTEELLHQGLNEVEGVREAAIDMVTCSLGVFTQFGLVLGQDRRYNFSGSETPSYKGGFRTLHFNDKEITGVPLYQNNRIDMWEKKALKLYVLSDLAFEGRDAGDVDATVLFGKLYAQLCYKNPFRTCSIRDLVTS